MQGVAQGNAAPRVEAQPGMPLPNAAQNGNLTPPSNPQPAMPQNGQANVAGNGQAAVGQGAVPQQPLQRQAETAVPRSQVAPVVIPPGQGAPRVVEGPASPREACGGRTNFSLHWCMQQQCAQPQFSAHPQCRIFRATGEVR